ncbi:unnamed protein product [Echinostoma caproni]|uniref:Mitochondrial assembly of ribosomal large subunit protein 1 n=1 Tax=Echinostoma caproni TaxID=27848 RepID=A0A183BCL5_9TREM|nr:unnamed protein product [Echinostoma caproni]
MPVVSYRLLPLLRCTRPNCPKFGRALWTCAIQSPSSTNASNYSTSSQKPSDPNNEENNVVEVYDVPHDQQWEENPEFDYTTQVIPAVYDFVTPKECFELNELRLVLKQENIQDLVFLHLPPNHVAEIMVIGSGTSAKHVRSTAGLIYRILKYKRRSSALGLPKVEGLEGSGDWIAINLGNILLHLFLPSVRMYYNLESLWVAGPRFDEATQLMRSQADSDQSDVQRKDVDWEEILREVQQQTRMSANRNVPSNKSLNQTGVSD